MSSINIVLLYTCVTKHINAVFLQHCAFGLFSQCNVYGPYLLLYSCIAPEDWTGLDSIQYSSTVQYTMWAQVKCILAHRSRYGHSAMYMSAQFIGVLFRDCAVGSATPPCGSFVLYGQALLSKRQARATARAPVHIITAHEGSDVILLYSRYIITIQSSAAEYSAVQYSTVGPVPTTVCRMCRHW